MKVDIFETDRKYSIIYADPPWSYSDNGCAGAAAAQYPTMSVEEICGLPIKKIASENAILFMWATYPKIEEALKVIKSWGFTFKSIAFQWIKLNRAASAEKLQKELESGSNIEKAIEKCCFFGLGRWTRGNSEPCLIAVKGKPKRINSSVGQLVFSPITRHSEKPSVVRHKIMSLTGEENKIELFARQKVDGWDCWGDEV